MLNCVCVGHELLLKHHMHVLSAREWSCDVGRVSVDGDSN